MDRPMRCMFKAHSRSRCFGIWLYEGRMGWKKSGVVLVRLIDQKLVLSW